MKPSLWIVFALALVTNVSTSLAFDGVKQVLISVGTGVVTLGSAAALFLLREKRQRQEKRA